MKLRRFMLLGGLAATAVIGTALAACGGDDDDDDVPPGQTAAPTATATPDPEPWRGMQVRFGLLPSEDQQSVLESGKLLETYLEKQLKGLDVKLFVGPAYAATIEAMKANELEFAFFGPFSYVLARDGGAKIEAAVAIQDFEGVPPSYYSVLYARGDSGITTLKDYVGKEDKNKIAFVDAGSTSGFLAPSKMLIDGGANIDTVRKNQILAGGHDKSAIATFAGQTQIGASFESMLYDLCKQGLIDTLIDKAGGGNSPGDCKKTGANSDPKDDLITLAKFQLPASPFAYRTTMDPKVSKAVVDAMLNWKKNDPESFAKYTEKYSDSKKAAFGMVAYTDKEFESIRGMCREEKLKEICATKK
jgi:phosphate/phosphite/phosphonate ABC transporter binding protein